MAEDRYAGSIAASVVADDGPLTPLSRPRSLQGTPVSTSMARPPANADDLDKNASTTSTRSNDDDSSRSRNSWDTASSCSQRSGCLGNSGGGFDTRRPGTPTRRSPLTDNNSNKSSFNPGCGGLDSVPTSPLSDHRASSSSDDIGVPRHRPAAAAAQVAIFGESTKKGGGRPSRRSGNDFMLGDEIAMDMDLPDSDDDDSSSDPPPLHCCSAGSMVPATPPEQALPDSKNNSVTSSASVPSPRSAHNKSSTMPFVETAVVFHCGGGSKDSSGGCRSYASSLNSSGGSGGLASVFSDDVDGGDDAPPPHATRNAVVSDLVTQRAAHAEHFVADSSGGAVE